MKLRLDEINILKELMKYDDELVSFKVLSEIEVKGEKLPIVSITVGKQDKNLPVFGIFGGVHGLERIGSQLALSYFSNLFEQLQWDQGLRDNLQHYRIVSIPIINPGGMAQYSRSNPNGIDIMRNSPIEAEKKDTYFLVSGHRYSSKLPWYRGEEGSEMEVESQTLVDFVKDEMFDAEVAVSIDLHSGFGMKDRLWYPYAKSKDLFLRYEEVNGLLNLFDGHNPHHIYQVEAQSDSYLTHGDIWDYIFEEREDFNKKSNENKVFIPFTLEMGSWTWIKKNPIQLFSKNGIFNPMKDHRYKRVMRRHRALLDFCGSAVRNSKAWLK